MVKVKGWRLLTSANVGDLRGALQDSNPMAGLGQCDGCSEASQAGSDYNYFLQLGE